MSKILVKSKGKAFRRAGIEFNAKGVELDVSTLSEQQLEQIRSEPNLVVTEVADADGLESTGTPNADPSAPPAPAAEPTTAPAADSKKSKGGKK